MLESWDRRHRSIELPKSKILVHLVSACGHLNHDWQWDEPSDFEPDLSDPPFKIALCIGSWDLDKLSTGSP